MDHCRVTGVTPLTGELSDGICEAVLVSPHPRGRFDTICNIVQEICETIAWLNGSKTVNDQELPRADVYLMWTGFNSKEG